MKGNYGRGQNIWRPPLHKSRRLSRFKHLHALKSCYRDGNSSTLLTKSCFLSFSALHLFPPSSFPSLFVSCFFFFFFSFVLTKIPRTGGQAAKPKGVFPEQDQKKPKKTSTTRKETHKTKSRERQEALQNTSTVNCLFLAATDRRNKHKNTSSLLLHSFLPSSTYICLFFILVIFLHFIGGVFVEEFGLELLPRMMIRPSPTSIATPVRPTKQQNIHTTTKNSCRTPVHGTDTTD